MSNYVLLGYRFEVDWGGTKIGFQEVSGMDMKTDVVEYVHGAMPNGTAPMRRPGKTVYSESISLKRGYFRGDSEMQDWMEAVKTDETARRNVVITLLDEQGQPVMVWNVINAWVSAIGSVSLNAANSEALIEDVTITHEGYKLEMV